MTPLRASSMRVNFTISGIYHEPFVIGLINQNLQQSFPDPGITPADKTPVRIAPAPQVRRQIPPRRTHAHYPEHRIDEQAIVFGNAPPRRLAARVGMAPVVTMPCLIYRGGDGAEWRCSCESPLSLPDALIILDLVTTLPSVRQLLGIHYQGGA